jgi:hypothetical protein
MHCEQDASIQSLRVIEVSYEVSLLVAENMAKHAAKIMVNAILGKRKNNVINKMPLSNYTIQCQPAPT